MVCKIFYLLKKQTILKLKMIRMRKNPFGLKKMQIKLYARHEEPTSCRQEKELSNDIKHGRAAFLCKQGSYMVKRLYFKDFMFHEFATEQSYETFNRLSQHKLIMSRRT